MEIMWQKIKLIAKKMDGTSRLCAICLMAWIVIILFDIFQGKITQPLYLISDVVAVVVIGIVLYLFYRDYKKNKGGKNVEKN
jgi:hypothetical protein